MEHVISADGTRIAYETLGDGPPLIIVNGAFGTAADSAALAGELVRAGFRAVDFDRRARGCPFLRAGAERLAGLIPGAEFVEVPQSVGHRLDPEATAPVIAARLRTS